MTAGKCEHDGVSSNIHKKDARHGCVWAAYRGLGRHVKPCSRKRSLARFESLGLLATPRPGTDRSRARGGLSVAEASHALPDEPSS